MRSSHIATTGRSLTPVYQLCDVVAERLIVDIRFRLLSGIK